MAWFNRNDGYYVYWLCDEYGVLYVGYTENPGRRINEHRKSKAWFKDVTSIDIMRYSTKQEALKEEAMSIMFGENLRNIQQNARLARQAFYDVLDGKPRKAVEQYLNVPVGRF